jgi:GNAT superfamily N-acetyltransferase
MSDFADYQLKSQLKDHAVVQSRITENLWDEFMFHDPVSNALWGDLFACFPEFQQTLFVGGRPAGVVNALPLEWKAPLDTLPDEGWDWAFQKGVEDHRKKKTPNLLCGLQIAVAQEFQGQGLSAFLVQAMKETAREHNLKALVIPVRPTWKSRYPLIPMDDYIRWTRDDGLPFDPWLRIHVKANGAILHPCPRAMTIPGTVAQWEEWTHLSFLQSGDYIIPGALVPMKMDIKQDLGLYVEPNVWVVHHLAE